MLHTADTALAIDGGTPVRATPLPYARQMLDEADIQAVVQVLRGDWLTTGPTIAEFERALAARVGAQHAVAVSNGTAALHAAVYAAKLQTDDEVIVTPMTFAASANCARYAGASVRFADVRPDTLNLDPLQVERAITARTRAIVTVDYAGQPSDLEQINSIARRHNLPVIEDAAHALGATYHGRSVGSLADLTTFSLHPVKHITTGEGGVITTNDPDLAARMRTFRSHGINSDHRTRALEGSWFYEMEDLGYNYRITDFQCALGLSQLGKLDAWLERRRDIAAAYTSAFSEFAELEPPAVLSDRQSAWHLYVVRLRLERMTADRGEIFRALRAENIGVNVHYIPVPWHPYYQRLGYSKGDWPVAESAYERMISLPMFPSMSEADVGDVIEAVRKVIRYYRR
jgi:perosamine synthetase